MQNLWKYILVAVVLTFTIGCPEKVSSNKTGKPVKSDAGNDMVNYLKQQRLPAMDSVEPWKSEYGDGVVIYTKHYEIYTTLMEPLMLSQVPGFMESCYRGYNDQLPQSIETQTRFKMYLFADRQQWEKFTTVFTGPQAELYLKIKAGAYYLNGACVAYNIGRERTFSVLGHEGWHQFDSRNFNFRLPSWLDEGIAMLFEATVCKDGIFYFEPGKNGYRLATLKKALMEGKTIPLTELLGMNPGEAVMKDQTGDAISAFYGQAYGLVRFLREENYGKRLGDYHRMMLGGLRGDWPLSNEDKIIAADRNIPLTVGWNRFVGPKLFNYYIGDDLDKIEQEYIRFCRKIVYHVRFN